MNRFSLKRDASAQVAAEPVEATAREAGESTQVNLIPHLVRNSIAVHRIRKIFVWVVVVLIAGLVAIWLLQSAAIMSAQARIDDARAQSESLGAQVKALAPIGQMYALLNDQEGFLTGALSSQVRTADVVDALKTDAGRRVTFSNLSVTLTGLPRPEAVGAEVTTCPDADPFTTEVIVGCISFTAQGRDREDVANFLERASANPLFVDPYVTTTSVGETGDGAPQVTFSGSAGLSLDALSNPPSTEDREALLQAITQAEQQAANPTPDPSAAPSEVAE